MNLMGFDADGLGNHNFDRGSAYLRNTLIPLADFPYVSANVVDANGQDADRVVAVDDVQRRAAGSSASSGSRTRTRRTLVFPGAFDPFSVTAATRRACRPRSTRFARRARRSIVVMGHDGATAGTLTTPTGPLVDLADALKNVDAVIGDHTNFQVLTTRPNGTS